MAILKLVRLPNLLIIALTQGLIKFFFIPLFGVGEALSSFNFLLLVLATLCIAAAGYIINDIEDVGIDKINKPNQLLIGKKISEKLAFRWYLLLNTLGVVCGFLVANTIDKPNFAAVFIVVSALLYMYATYLKRTLILGNLLIALLTGFVILIVGVFDVFPLISEATQLDARILLQRLLHYAVFAVVINFIREIVKDIIDVNGDKNFGIQSLAIVLGRDRAAQIVFALGFFLFLGVLYYTYLYFLDSQLLLAYFFILVAAPLLFFIIKAWSAQKREDFEFLSLLLKIIMVLGLSSLFLYQYA